MNDYRVTVAAHRVEGPYVCYLLPASTYVVRGLDERDARAQGCVRAHVAAGLPRWRPYLRQTWPHTRCAEWVSELERVCA